VLCSPFCWASFFYRTDGASWMLCETTPFFCPTVTFSSRSGISLFSQSCVLIFSFFFYLRTSFFNQPCVKNPRRGRVTLLLRRRDGLPSYLVHDRTTPPPAPPVSSVSPLLSYLGRVTAASSFSRFEVNELFFFFFFFVRTSSAVFARSRFPISFFPWRGSSPSPEGVPEGSAGRSRLKLEWHTFGRFHVVMTSISVGSRYTPFPSRRSSLRVSSSYKQTIPRQFAPPLPDKNSSSSFSPSPHELCL